MDNKDIFSLSLAAVSTTGALVTGADWVEVELQSTDKTFPVAWAAVTEASVVMTFAPTMEMAGSEDTGTSAETKELQSTVTEGSEVVIPEAESVVPEATMLTAGG